MSFLVLGIGANKLCNLQTALDLELWVELTNYESVMLHKQSLLFNLLNRNISSIRQNS